MVGIDAPVDFDCRGVAGRHRLAEMSHESNTDTQGDEFARSRISNDFVSNDEPNQIDAAGGTFGSRRFSREANPR